MRRALAERGVRVLGYVPESGLMVSSEGNVDLSALDVAWAGALEASDKLSPAVAAVPAPAYLVIFHPDVAMDEARALVARCGFAILQNPDLLPQQLLVAGGAAGLEALAASDEVSYIMPASADLTAGNPVIGCAGPVTEAGAIAEYATVGRGWSKDASGVAALKYVFSSLTARLDQNAARSEIERALREWTRYAKVSFAPGDSAGAARTVAIAFARGEHGDGYPFDGTGKVLAHTFYPAPPNPEPLAGDMHLDADENWRIGLDTDLFTVALHEAGHALGLGHSDRPGSVMYPYYRFAGGLTADDIAGARSLYGASDGEAPSQPTTPTEPANPPAPPPTSPTQPPAPPPTTPTQPPTPPPPTTPTQPPAGGDTTPPALRIVSPGSTIVSTSAASLAIAGTAADNVGVAMVKWSTSTGTSGTASGTANWSAKIPLLVGTNVATVRAYDAAGNSAWRSITVVRR
jgi:hypothetical protein